MTITILVNSGSEILVKPGDKIDFNTDLVRENMTEEVQIPLARLMGVPHRKIFDSLKKFVGEKVKKGDLIAEHNKLFIKKRYRSEYDGMIKEVNHDDGMLVLAVVSNEKSTAGSRVKGTVTDVEKNIISVEVKNGKTFPINQPDYSYGGNILYCKPGRAQILAETDISGHIIVTDKLLPYEHIKLETLGAKGFILNVPLTDKTFLPTVILKNEHDLKKILEDKKPYCTIDKASSTLYFYE